MGGGINGGFKGTKGGSIEISDKKMYQVGDHFNKHGREMGYSSKKNMIKLRKNLLKNIKIILMLKYLKENGMGLVIMEKKTKELLLTEIRQ